MSRHAAHDRCSSYDKARLNSLWWFCRFSVALLLVGPAVAANIFTSNFSDPNNVGSVGGGLLSGSASDVAINEGPWLGTYYGIAGVLAAPTLSIIPAGGTTGGAGVITGVLGVELLGLGLVNNYGWFYQDTGLSFKANSVYTLSADVSVGQILANVNLLSTDGVGIALTAGGDIPVASSTDVGALLSIQLLPSTTYYHMTMTFQTGATPPTGTIGVRLFDKPDGLLTVSLFSGATFSNVQLDETDAVPEPATLALAGVGLLFVAVWSRVFSPSEGPRRRRVCRGGEGPWHCGSRGGVFEP